MGNPDRPAEASDDFAATKVPDMPQRALYQQTVPVAVESGDGDGVGEVGDMPPSYEEAASSGSGRPVGTDANTRPGPGSGLRSVSAGSTAAAGSDHGNSSQHRAEAARTTSSSSRCSSLNAEASDALLGHSSSPDQRPPQHDNQQQQPKPADEDAAAAAQPSDAIDISGYKHTDPMRWDLRERNGDWNKLDGEPGCCVSSSGGCCFSSRGGCCFSDRGGCCFSDRGGCFFSDTGGCFFSSGGACCCSDHVERGPAPSSG
ncbi:hypothetical protein JDV02_005935 [Purpureocillium takamizusanense]|uniref:Uncharacterized protein n=1 Tax=Purpureocillium takamizusanense TaxID=2060973 RepID=A0A9Q8QH65_9HYPO|nr:uncharacterized protein JDV02_005935 [Purpureocillium takamizusanense]UNI19778.1 hypothetical protein JDV02_005935 [Purpureocillium takamizusanense]